MRVGDNPSISSDFSNNASTITLDQQITNELNVPVKAHDHEAANARRDAVGDIFKNLSPEDAKELYGRLEKYNQKDPLNDKFYGTFSKETVDSLKKSLKAQFEPQNGGAQTPAAAKAGKSIGAQQKTDVSSAGKTRADQLNDQLNAKDTNVPLKIAGRKDLNDFEKRMEIDQWMRNASSDDFQKMIQQSHNWPKTTQKLLDDAIENGFSGANQWRIAKELKPDQQIEMIKRLTGEGFSGAVGTILGQADPAVLNQVAKDFKNYPNFEIDPDNNKASGTLMHMLAGHARDLTPENRRALADTILHEGLPQQPLQSWRAFLTAEMFDSVQGNEQQARDLFAHIQQNGDLKQMLSNFKDQPVNFQHDFTGLGPNELKAMQQTFEQLANEADPGSQLQQIYLESARSAAEWSS